MEIAVCDRSWLEGLAVGPQVGSILQVLERFRMQITKPDRQKCEFHTLENVYRKILGQILRVWTRFHLNLFLKLLNGLNEALCIAIR